mgnify:CR=1 FL=1
MKRSHKRIRSSPPNVASLIDDLILGNGPFSRALLNDDIVEPAEQLSDPLGIWTTS